MDNEIKKIAFDVSNKIYEEIIRIPRSEYHKFVVNVGIGADGTPTKYIDKFAEDIAIDFIKKSKFNINILSEEAGFLDFDGDYTFILDPIDGTRNAIRGIPIYSISLGVGKKSISDVNFGIVKNIPTGDLFIAEKGNGAFLNNNQIKTPEIPDKEFIFSYLNEYIVDSTVLDLFSGSGSLGLEALSRGAGRVLFVEQSADQTMLIRKNLNRCGFGNQASILRNDVFTAVNRIGKKGEQFNLILADPPFKMNFHSRILASVYNGGILKANGLLFIEHESHDEGGNTDHGFNRIRQRKFGHCLVSIYGMGG